jgi:hypothetical protein
MMVPSRMYFWTSGLMKIEELQTHLTVGLVSFNSQRTTSAPSPSMDETCHLLHPHRLAIVGGISPLHH